MIESRMVAAALGESAAITTRSLTLADVSAVHAIDCASYVDPWSEDHLRAEVARSDRCHVVATRSDTVVGHGGLMLVEPEATLTTIAVTPEHRGARIATHLLLDLFAQAVDRGIEAITLEVRSKNHVAQALYRRFGFAPVGVRRGYYPAIGTGPADDALIMWAHDVRLPDFQRRLAAIDAASGASRPATDTASLRTASLDTGELPHD